MSLQPLSTSVIVRTYNESRFIGKVLNQIRSQSNIEVEIILVDNNSEDDTVNIAKPFVDHIVTIDKFRPGAAINLGIRSSKFDRFAIISGHCVPVGLDWLSKLLSPFDTHPEIAGVYGRQVPTSFSSPYDKRDLWTTFGAENKLQTVDPFFHNANSALTREIWEKQPFSEIATNVEDRIWAKQILKSGMKIKYQADAIVDHWHGINHGGDKARAQNVVQVLEEFGVYVEN